MKKKLLFLPVILLMFVLLLTVAVGAEETDENTALRVAPGRTVIVTLPETVGNFTYNEDVVMLRGFSTDESGVTTLLFVCREDVPVGTYDLLYIDGEASMGISLYPMGDANMDGDVSTRDAVLIKQAIVGMTDLSSTQRIFSNVYDSDNEVNTRDAVLVLQHIVGMDVTLGTPDGDTAVCNGATLSIVDGYLYATYLDAPETPVNLGRVKGEDGLSAFEIYQKYHPEYQGTEAGWIESLKGDQGVSVTDAYVDADYHLWLVLSDGTKKDAGYVGVTPTEDTDVRTITFYTNGGSTVAPIKQKAGTPLTAPEAPVRTGYVFSGWYTDTACTRVYDFTTMPDENIALFAKWKLATYKITYHLNGGVSYNPTSYTVFSSDLTLEDATKTGHTFAGWYFEPSFENRVFLIEGGSAADWDIYAKFVPNQYTITFDTQGGSVVLPITQDYGTPLAVPADPTNEDGSLFLGWYLDAACTLPYTFSTTMPDRNVVVYAKWRVKITFNTQGGSEIAPVYAKPGDILVAPTPPQKSGYFFTGWYTDSACRIPYDFDAVPLNDFMLYAGWVYEYATLEVVLRYIDPEGNPLTDDWYGTSVVYRTVYAMENVSIPYSRFDYFVLLGWNEDKEQAMAGVIDPNCTQNIWRDKTLYSVMRKKEVYTVTLLNSDGSLFSTLEVGEGGGISSAPTPRAYGQVFSRWVIDGAFDSTPDNIVDNCTFRAVFVAADGTIGKVAPGTITVDGIKDPAYMTSGAYLPVNITLQADRSTTRAEATVDADTYLVWDGDYIYMLLEVSDKTLVGRAEAYVKGGVDAYLNDTVEIWYNFEQDMSKTNNETRVGIDAMGYSKYALPRSVYNGNVTGIGGGRSTHYDDIVFAVRNNVKGDQGTDLSRTGYKGNATWREGNGAEPEYMASYIMEIKFPAWTEGAADTSKGADPRTGLLPGKSEDSNNIADYAFTSGTKLVDGDIVRFNIQINDLMIAQKDMTGAPGTYFWDCPPVSALREWAGYATASPSQLRSMLYATDGAGNIIGMADTSDLFSVSGATQRQLQYYVMFSLSNNATAETIVTALGSKTVDGSVVPTMLKADGSEYVRG